MLIYANIAIGRVFLSTLCTTSRRDQFVPNIFPTEISQLAPTPLKGFAPLKLKDHPLILCEPFLLKVINNGENFFKILSGIFCSLCNASCDILASSKESSLSPKNPKSQAKKDTKHMH